MNHQRYREGYLYAHTVLRGCQSHIAIVRKATEIKRFLDSSRALGQESEVMIGMEHGASAFMNGEVLWETGPAVPWNDLARGFGFIVLLLVLLHFLLK